MPYGLTYSLSLIFLCVVYQLHLYYSTTKKLVNNYFIIFKNFFFSFIFLFFPLILINTHMYTYTRRKIKIPITTRRTRQNLTHTRRKPPKITSCSVKAAPRSAGSFSAQRKKKRPIPSGLILQEY